MSEQPHSVATEPSAKLEAMKHDVPRWWPPTAGVLSAGVGLAVGELVASIADAAGPVVVVGDGVVDRVPSGLKKWAIDVFGTNDKIALIAGVMILTAIYAAFVGRAASKRFRAGLFGVVAFASVGIAAALSGRSPSARDTAGVAAAFLATIGCLWLLVGGKPHPSTGVSENASVPESMRAPAVVGRRQFLAMTGGATAVAAGSLVGSRALKDDVVAASAKPIPPTVRRLPVKKLMTESGIENMPPFFSPNDNFYRIDTALVIPQVDASTWSVKVVGKVERELTISYQDLRSEKYGPLIEHDCTLMCVSNEIGGDLVGNARWTGVRLSDILKAAGVQDGATQIFLTSVDGFTAGFPTEVALDGREALLAIGMNGEPLPARHGFPARLVIPGIYGYVSAVKWISEIKLTTFEDDQGYWLPRGWSALAPVKTCSRIDVVGTGGRIGPVAPGPTPIGGVAWAQHVGIAKVEVQVDDGPWREAKLAEDGGIDTWRQWSIVWDATPGRHDIRVRATDSTGFTQNEAPVPVAPDGAEGWHSVGVKVTQA
jgi:DMSO/TMAO reductase YedYZ molybdopterin-dependent catalytic subunit